MAARSKGAEATLDEDFAATGCGAYRRVMNEISRYARDPHIPILLEGESGTGKTTIARRIHDASPRAQRAFQSVNLGALEESLCASELFGHVVGAYTGATAGRRGQFASADGGTIFLDEIGKAPRRVQQCLLQVIEYGEFTPVGADRSMRVDVRVVAASNQCLATMAAEGDMLPDLYARLEIFRIVLPPLRERRDEIPSIVEQILEEIVLGRMKRDSTPVVHPELMSALQNAPWPNNLRQLKGTLHRLVLDARCPSELTLGDCYGAMAYLRDFARLNRSAPSRAEIEKVVSEQGGITAAARVLGCDRTTLHRRLRSSQPSVETTQP